MHRERSAGAAAPLPYAMMALNGAIWTVYGIILRDWVPMVAANSVGFAAGSYALYTYHRYAKVEVLKSRAKQLAVGAGCAVLTLLLFTRHAIAVGHHPVVVGVGALDDLMVAWTVQLVGNLGVGITVAMFASPLATMAEVCRSRSAASLSSLAAFASLACTILWFTYGVIIGDVLVWAPNFCGLTLSLAQLALIGATTTKRKTFRGHDPESGVASKEIVEPGMSRSLDDDL